MSTNIKNKLCNKLKDKYDDESVYQSMNENSLNLSTHIEEQQSIKKQQNIRSKQVMLNNGLSLNSLNLSKRFNHNHKLSDCDHKLSDCDHGNDDTSTGLSSRGNRSTKDSYRDSENGYGYIKNLCLQKNMSLNLNHKVF